MFTIVKKTNLHQQQKIIMKWYKYFVQTARTLIIYPLFDITFKKIYCVPLFRLFRRNCL